MIELLLKKCVVWSLGPSSVVALQLDSWGLVETKTYGAHGQQSCHAAPWMEQRLIWIHDIEHGCYGSVFASGSEFNLKRTICESACRTPALQKGRSISVATHSNLQHLTLGRGGPTRRVRGNHKYADRYPKCMPGHNYERAPKVQQVRRETGALSQNLRRRAEVASHQSPVRI